MIQQLLPAKPPCFRSSLDWLEYVVSADGAHKEKEKPGLGPFVHGSSPEQFNPEFDFCGDCNDADYIAHKKAQGKCNPQALKATDACTPASRPPVNLNCQSMPTVKGMWALIANAGEPIPVSDLLNAADAQQIAKKTRKSVAWICKTLVSRGYLNCSTKRLESNSVLWWDATCKVPPSLRKKVSKK